MSPNCPYGTVQPAQQNRQENAHNKSKDYAGLDLRLTINCRLGGRIKIESNYNNKQRR